MEFKDKQKTLFARKKDLIRKATPSEKLFMLMLDTSGIQYIFQKGFINGGGYYIVDFYIPKPYKLCIEIDGGYHQTSKQILYDKRKDRYLKEERGFKVLRINNEDVGVFNMHSITMKHDNRTTYLNTLYKLNRI